MRKNIISVKPFLSLLALVAVLLITSATTLAAARITIVNGDGPDEGFNDPTPAQPVGGNMGTTIGQQRMIAFQKAADIWGMELDSNVEIRIFSSFDPLTCTANSATLGSAGAINIFRNFNGSQFFNTWYHGALADKRSNTDLLPGAADIRARFNSEIGKTGCLPGGGFYYGLDENEPAGQSNLVAVLLHEFAHGLGFSNFVSLSTGAKFNGADDIYMRNIRDNTLNKQWPDMTNAERASSAVNTNNVVWTGANVTAAAPTVLGGTPVVTINSPAAIARDYTAGTASFGPPVTQAGTTGNVVLANDGVGTVTDGCEAISSAVSGNIALIDRGTCGFVVKVKNAQNAGAIGVIIANNAAGAAPGLGGSDSTITIPTLSVSQADGNTIKASLAAGNTVNATLRINPARLAGADSANRVQLYAPNPLEPGSSISHWNTTTFPNQLMEPAINSDLTFSVKPPQDLTLPQMRDVGWFQDRDSDGLADGMDNSLATYRTTATLTRDCSTGEYVAQITLTNRGTSTANGVFLFRATLNGTESSSFAGGSIRVFGTMAPGASGTTTIRFPSSAGAAGARATLFIYGLDTTTFRGNNFSTGTSKLLPACAVAQ